MGFPGGSDSKESACNAGDPSLTPGSGRSPGEENGYPLQYSCLEHPGDRDAWRLQSMGSQGVAQTGGTKRGAQHSAGCMSASTAGQAGLFVSLPGKVKV